MPGELESFFLSDEWEGNEGLRTGLWKLSTATLAHIAKEVEAFLDDVVRTFLGDVNKDEPQPETRKAKEIQELEEKLRDDKSIDVVPTNKMNSLRIIDKEKYIDWINRHLLEGVAKEILADKLLLIFDDAFELLHDLEDILSIKEREFIEESLKTRAIPMPKLLIKDHKKEDSKGEAIPNETHCSGNKFYSGIPKDGIPWTQSHIQQKWN